MAIDAVVSFLDAVGARRLAEAEWGLTIPDEHPLDIGVRVVDGLVRVQAFALPAAHAPADADVLHWNRGTRIVRFARTRSGDVWVQADVLVESVSEAAFDQILGLVVGRPPARLGRPQPAARALPERCEPVADDDRTTGLAKRVGPSTARHNRGWGSHLAERLRLHPGSAGARRFVNGGDEGMAGLVLAPRAGRFAGRCPDLGTHAVAKSAQPPNAAAARQPATHRRANPALVRRRR